MVGKEKTTRMAPAKRGGKGGRMIVAAVRAKETL